MKNTKMALIYDFDKTLSPKDMQNFHLIESFGYKDPAEFWKKSNELAEKKNVDSILAYMYLIINENKDMTKQQLRDEGRYIKLYKGVETWFDRINEYGKAHHVDVEHYIISSGLTEIIKGTAIAKKFRKIYGCSYLYGEDGRVLWPSRVVNYTTKTQYIFRINKGVLDETNDDDLNKSTPDEDKYIPYENMVYVGDGLTDVPSMKVVSGFGGTTIAVFNNEREKADNLKNDKRATYAVKADYSKNSKIEKIVMGLIDTIEIRNKLNKL